jgi:cellulose synthase/poly-beta-1,6-N-acetylglucosamine synthase-like glycosyltransferase
LLLLRRPSFWRVFLHAACVLYILVALPLMLNYSPPLLLVVSGAALVAGLPEATAADWWARLVYYAVFLFWLSLIVAPLVVALLP